MKPIVSIFAQGSMGAATAVRLVENGLEVRTITTGRSAASIERAKNAGMRSVDTEEFIQADFILSIVPPAEAIPLAKHLAPFLMQSKKKPVYVDLNAINPDTAMMVAMVLQSTGCTVVDGGIIGGPPRAGYDGPVYYVSGEGADKVNGLAAYGLKVSVLDGPIGAASALKMSYAGITKGLIAVGSAMILAATRAGVADALHAELSASQSGLMNGFTRSIPDMFGKAGRWVAEMEQIAGFAGNSRAEHGLYEAIAELYSRIDEDNNRDKQEIDALGAFVSIQNKH